MIEVTLETNLKIKLAELPPLNSEVSKKLVSVHSWIAAAADETVVIGVTRIEAKPTVPADLDNSIKRGVGDAAKALGDTNPKFEIEVAKVSGLEARRANYQGTNPFRIDTVSIRDGQKIFQIQVFYTSAGAQDAQRILNSVKISVTK